MKRLLSFAALILVIPAAASAQRFGRGDDGFDRAPRASAGASFSYGRPVGDFLHYVEQGFGFDAFVRGNVDPQGVLSFRLDGGYLIYGRETFRVPLSGTIGGRILVDLTTNNNIVWMGFGPQLTLPGRYFRPYANAAIGFSYFFTESSVEGSNSDNEPFASTTNYSDATFRYGFGWGLLIPFQTRTTEWAIDLGAAYHGNGQVRYLREGGIEDRPDGSIVLHPIQSDANLLTYRLGFSVSLR
ncbi:MAG: hypothetical protein HUU26_04445 [Gemmatimonadaceae bacterium]|nr:hypothetical protein [Gemmatimonadaceae bacterium]